ncbi:hypothetical protein [uncultured Sphingomonas sp.]|uniref:hypothetical protein n=1 Tax=uncultured Sphingomonas sp. TaxID=158754 RepID=UPI0035C9FD09
MAGQIIPVLIARARHRMVADLKSRGATSPDRAVAYDPDDHSINRRVFARMRDDGVVVETAPGRYHLNEAGLDAFHASRRRRGALIAGVAAVIAGLIAAGG